MNTLAALHHWLPIAFLAIGGIIAVHAIRTKAKPKPTDFAQLSLIGLFWAGDTALSGQDNTERVSKGIAVALIAISMSILAWRWWKNRHQPIDADLTNSDPHQEPTGNRL